MSATSLQSSADLVIEDAPDIDQPNETVRRARRVDPLLALRRAGSIGAREFDAAERLRADLEASQPSMPTCMGRVDAVFVAPNLRIGISERQIAACASARAALDRVPVVARAAVLWVALGGTVDGYREWARCRKATVCALVARGLAGLADYYFGDELAEPASAGVIRAAAFDGVV